MFKSMLVSIFCVFCALAQESQAPNGKPLILQLGDPGMVAPIGFPVLLGSNSRVTGAPYSAQSVTERVQVLADGNRIVQTTSSTIARDSEGRVRMERGEPQMGDPNAPRLITIEDPVAGYNYTLDPRTKTVFKHPPMKDPAKNLVLSTNTFQGAPGKVLTVQTIGKEPLSSDSAAKVDLGSQTMEGVVAQGTRITNTIPAGSIGNEQPIMITTETWYSPELKALVMSKSSDPRIGETTYKLTDIQRGEPSPSLFQVPSDYTVKDQPGNIFFQKLKTDAEASSK
ncbi:MAG: hypothetical protein WB992_04165 [Bryobacteraceae bacterium]